MIRAAFESSSLRANRRRAEEAVAVNRFLDDPSGDTFGALFELFAPQVLAFFRARSCEAALAEDLTQEVMLTVHRKAAQIRDRALFRAWLFRVARNTLLHHYERAGRQVATIDLAEVGEAAGSCTSARTAPFEFDRWMSFLDSGERRVMHLRFVEDWEYHEIAAAQRLPIGTVQWKIHNSKKKLAAHLTAACRPTQKAA